MIAGGELKAGSGDRGGMYPVSEATPRSLQFPDEYYSSLTAALQPSLDEYVVGEEHLGFFELFGRTAQHLFPAIFGKPKPLAGVSADYSGFDVVQSAGRARLLVREYDWNGRHGIVVAGNLYDVASFIFHAFDDLYFREERPELMSEFHPTLAQTTRQIATIAEQAEYSNWLRNPSDVFLHRGMVEYKVRFNDSTSMYEVVLRPSTEDAAAKVPDGFWQKYWKASLDDFRSRIVRELETATSLWGKLVVSDIRSAFEKMLGYANESASDLIGLITIGLRDAKTGDAASSRGDSNPEVEAGIRLKPDGSVDALVLRFIEATYEGGVNLRTRHIANVSEWVGKPSEDGKVVYWNVSATAPGYSDPLKYKPIVEEVFAYGIVHKTNRDGNGGGVQGPSTPVTPAPKNGGPVPSDGQMAKSAGIGGYSHTGEKTDANSGIEASANGVQAMPPFMTQELGVYDPLLGAQTAMPGAVNTASLSLLVQ